MTGGRFEDMGVGGVVTLFPESDEDGGTGRRSGEDGAVVKE